MAKKPTPKKKVAAKKKSKKTAGADARKKPKKKQAPRRRSTANSKALQMRKDAFLDFLGQSTNVTQSCGLSALDRNHAYDLRDRDEDFRIAWDRAIEQGTEAMIDEATRRATKGVDDDVYGRDADGNYIIIGKKNKRSDRLLEFLLKARKQEMFRPSADLTHHGDIDMNVGVNKSVLDLITETMRGIEEPDAD